MNVCFSHISESDTRSAQRHSVFHIKPYDVPLFDQGHKSAPDPSPYLRELFSNGIKDPRLARASFKVLQASEIQAQVGSLKER